MTDIETRLFRYFVALAQELHSVEPRQTGHQSADAHAPIQKLEARLGTKLADRGGNTYVELTAAGSASGKRVTVHRIGMKQER